MTCLRSLDTYKSNFSAKRDSTNQHNFESIHFSLLLVEACLRVTLQSFPRRLLDEQKTYFKSGSIYVNNETLTGIQRWRDGYRRTSSRLIKGFWLYHQLQDDRGEKSAKGRAISNKRFQRTKKQRVFLRKRYRPG
jgi:hypothetical protein